MYANALGSSPNWMRIDYSYSAFNLVDYKKSS